MVFVTRMDIFGYESCCAPSENWILKDRSIHVLFFRFICSPVYGLHHCPSSKVKSGTLWPGPQSHTVQSHMGVLGDRPEESQLDRPTAYTTDEAFPCATNQVLCKEAQGGRHYCSSSPFYKGQTEALGEGSHLLKTIELIRGRAKFQNQDYLKPTLFA